MRQSLRSPLQLRLLVFLAEKKVGWGRGCYFGNENRRGVWRCGGGKAVKSFALKAFFHFVLSTSSVYLPFAFSTWRIFFDLFICIWIFSLGYVRALKWIWAFTCETIGKVLNSIYFLFSKIKIGKLKFLNHHYPFPVNFRF